MVYRNAGSWEVSTLRSSTILHEHAYERRYRERSSQLQDELMASKDLLVVLKEVLTANLVKSSAPRRWVLLPLGPSERKS